MILHLPDKSALYRPAPKGVASAAWALFRDEKCSQAIELLEPVLGDSSIGVTDTESRIGDCVALGLPDSSGDGLAFLSLVPADQVLTFTS